MSEADKEQRQAILDDIYNLTKKEICSSRKIQESDFEKLINEKMGVTASEGIKEKLVDTLVRWVDYTKFINGMYPNGIAYESPYNYSRENLPFDDKWSEPGKIAIVYAIGACAMNEGINSRALYAHLKAALGNPKVKAIVLRVDSPGGDAMASDYISEIIKNDNPSKKPIIVSQGYVAASGGYWLSMNADKIVAAPNTITGSIGVIGGWIYDKGLKKDLGISTDFVKVGDHADLAMSFQLPLIGIGLPIRNLNESELKIVEEKIRSMYGEFIKKVASGRKMKEEDIEKIAQGRVWSGIDGKELGLVDELGGLDRAIQIAKEQAGFKSCDEVEIIEYYVYDKMSFVDYLMSSFGIETKQIKDNFQFIRFLMEQNGVPMPLLPLDFIPDYSME